MQSFNWQTVFVFFFCFGWCVHSHSHPHKHKHKTKSIYRKQTLQSIPYSIIYLAYNRTPNCLHVHDEWHACVGAFLWTPQRPSGNPEKCITDKRDDVESDRSKERWTNKHPHSRDIDKTTTTLFALFPTDHFVQFVFQLAAEIPNIFALRIPWVLLTYHLHAS